MWLYSSIFGLLIFVEVLICDVPKILDCFLPCPHDNMSVTLLVCGLIACSRVVRSRHLTSKIKPLLTLFENYKQANNKSHNDI